MGNEISGSNDLKKVYIPPEAPLAAPAAANQILVESQISKIDEKNVVTQDFRQPLTNISKSYSAGPGQPLLEMLNPEEGTAPTPLEPTWKRKVNDYYKDQVKKRVVKMLQEGGANATALAQLLKELKTEKGQEKAPAKEGSSAKEVSGEKEGVSGYSEEQIDEIVNTLLTGDNSSLPPDVQNVLAEATQATADDWGLPSSWKIDSNDPVDWTPTTTDAAHPSQFDVISDNLDQFENKIEDITQKIVDKMGPDNPETASIMGYSKMILDIIRELKDVIKEFEDLDSKKPSSGITIEDIKEASKKISEAIEKQEKAEKAKKKHRHKTKIGRAFEKIGKGIAGSALVVVGFFVNGLTAGLCPQTLNIGLYLVGSKTRAALIPGVYSDPTKKFEHHSGSSKAPTEVERLMKDYQVMLKQFLAQNENAQQACGDVSQDILSMVLLLAILSKMVGGGGANTAEISDGDAQAPTSSSDIISLLSSKKLSSHITTTLEESGAMVNSDENEKLTMNMMVMTLPLILSLAMVAMGKGAIGLPKEKSEGDAISKSGEKIDAAIEKIISEIGVEQSDAITDCQTQLKALLKLLKQLTSDVTENPEVKEASEKVKASRQEVATIVKELSDMKIGKGGLKDTQALLDQLTAAQDNLKKSMDELKGALNESVKAISDKNADELKGVAQSTKDDLLDVLKGIENPSIPQEKMDEWLSRLNEIGNEGSALAPGQENGSMAGMMQQLLGDGLGESIFIGTIGLDIIKDLKFAGDEEGAEKINQVLVKLFDQLETQFQKNLGGDTENLNQFNQAFGIAFNPANQNLSTLGHHMTG